MAVRWLAESHREVVGDIPTRWYPRPETIDRKHFWWIIILNDFTDGLDGLLVWINAVHNFGNVMEGVGIRWIPIWRRKVDCKTTMDLRPTADVLEKCENLRNLWWLNFYSSSMLLLHFHTDTKQVIIQRNCNVSCMSRKKIEETRKGSTKWN